MVTPISAINSNVFRLFEILPNTWGSQKTRSKWAIPKQEENFVHNFLKTKISLEKILIQYQNSQVEGNKSDADYERYLQFPDSTVRAVAISIVSPSDSDDEKMYKIEQWVQENIEYKTDMANYGRAEYWALPTLTLNKKSGDCEDGAFLIHSLGLHAGVSPDNLRTYGGLVKTNSIVAPLGGHGWTAYKREIDGEWITLDWCYYPTEEQIPERITMGDNMKYIDDWFYVGEVEGTVETPLTNKVRYACNQLLVRGLFVDIRA